MERADVVIVGTGAAGLFAAIWAGREARRSGRAARRIVALDGAARLGAKILVAGGGRCNVTHDVADESAYAGSSRHAIKKVLRRFDVPAVVAFFRELGVELKREETGKLFPTTDRAQTVLDALLRAARDAGVEILHPRRVEAVEHVPSASAPSIGDESNFAVRGGWGAIVSPRVVLATGGKSLPKTGSDGHGFDIARGLGHSVTPRVFPALVPLVLAPAHFIRRLSGLTVPATLEVRSGTGKRLVAFTDSMLCTHFGLSGPSVLDISRHWTDARLDDPAATLRINWLPDETVATLDAALLAAAEAQPAAAVARLLRHRLPERLLDALREHAGAPRDAPLRQWPREKRKAFVEAVVDLPLPVVGDRGFTFAEVTAGGVPLRELHLETMASRVAPGLHLCGEICDVDGRIGGYNFQWAWASSYVAGISV